jgi:sugar lactone lactonase YvrE
MFTPLMLTAAGESPSWDGQSARLLSVDINGKKIFVLNPDTQQHETVSLPEMIGAVRWLMLRY